MLARARQPTDVASESMADVLTDRVVTDAVSPAPSTVATSGTPARSRWRDAPKGVSRGWWWVCAVMVTSVLIHAGLAMWNARTVAPESGPARAAETVAPAQLPTHSVRPEPDRAVGRLESQQNLQPSSLPLTTAAGTLAIAKATDDEKASVALLNGTAIAGPVRAGKVTLVHRTVYSDRDVIVGFTQCNDTAAPCAHRQPFWLELRDGAPPNLRQMPGVWASTGAGSATATDVGVQVNLGVWNGERRTAVFTVGGNIVITRSPEPSRPLGRADCATVIQSAESCATSRDCSSFATSAQRITPSQRAQLARLYHESTGLDYAAFGALCVRSCELGLRSSAVRRRDLRTGLEDGES